MARVKSIPDDVYDRFAMYDMQLEDLYLPAATANPMSLVVHVLHWLMLAPLFTAKDEAESILRSTPSRKGVGGRWERWEDEGKASKIGMGGAWTVRVASDSRGQCLRADYHCDLSLHSAGVRKLGLPVHQIQDV
jgi:hypothetical protein